MFVSPSFRHLGWVHQGGRSVRQHD